jgi:hypothetical protein
MLSTISSAANMIPVTKDKLEEARFFLGHLREGRAKNAYPNKSPSAHFRYYLHAFTVAARSVTWAMQKEETEKYKAWLPSWEAQVSEAEGALLELTNTMRKSAAHGWRIETITRSEDVRIPINMKTVPYQAFRPNAFLLMQGWDHWNWTAKSRKSQRCVSNISNI